METTFNGKSISSKEILKKSHCTSAQSLFSSSDPKTIAKAICGKYRVNPKQMASFEKMVHLKTTKQNQG